MHNLRCVGRTQPVGRPAYERARPPLRGTAARPNICLWSVSAGLGACAGRRYRQSSAEHSPERRRQVRLEERSVSVRVRRRGMGSSAATHACSSGQYGTVGTDPGQFRTGSAASSGQTRDQFRADSGSVKDRPGTSSGWIRDQFRTDP